MTVRLQPIHNSIILRHTFRPGQHPLLIPKLSLPGEAVTTILLVDDDVAVCEMLDGLLSDHGYDVVTAPDTVAGLERFRGHPEIDLCVLDLVMPDGCPDGVELARSIKAARPNMPVILMTGYYSTADAARNIAGALLHKPFRVEQLVTEIGRQLRQCSATFSRS